MKFLALDLGDQWVGSALSDSLGFFARPFKTVKAHELEQFLIDLFAQEEIPTIILGYPKTMKGTESEQTKKIIETKKTLEEKFSEKKWLLWDERLSSKRASSLKKAVSKEEKIKAHSIAAAFILESYLTFLHYSDKSTKEKGEE